MSGSGEGSSSPLCYISPGLSLPVPNFPLHSVELLTSLLSSTFLPKFLHFYIIFTPNLSHLLSPSLPPTSSPRPIPTHPTPIKHVPEVRSVWSSGDWLARVSTFHWTQKNLGGFPTFGTLRAQSEWWLGTPLHARRGTELGTKSDSPTPAAPVMWVCVSGRGEASLGGHHSVFLIPCDLYYSQWHQAKAAKPGAGALWSPRKRGRRRRISIEGDIKREFTLFYTIIFIKHLYHLTCCLLSVQHSSCYPERFT